MISQHGSLFIPGATGTCLQAHSHSLRPAGNHHESENLEGRGHEPLEVTLPLPSLPQTSTATTTAMVVEAVAAAAVPLAVGPLVEGARARGGRRLPGAPAAPGAAGGSGCWACCSPGYCSWGCSSASSLWVRVAGPCCLFRRAGTSKYPTCQVPRGQRSWVQTPCSCRCGGWGSRRPLVKVLWLLPCGAGTLRQLLVPREQGPHASGTLLQAPGCP